MKQPIWTAKDNQISFSQGWSVFTTDDGIHQIQKLDDPENANDVDIYEGPIFDDDEDAFGFVVSQAKVGCSTAIKALWFTIVP